MLLKRLTVAAFAVVTAITGAAAQDGSGKVDTGDTAWMLVSCALVMLMTPGLALFYGGMVRQKNVLSTIMHSFTILAIATVHWVVIGYALAFGPSLGGFIGKPVWAFLSGVGQEPNADYAATIPHAVFMAFQMMFAIITPALISGAIAERMKFSTFVVFVLLWLTLVYAPVAHWVWGVGGWLRNMGALDFAGGTVVHISSGVSGLVAALLLRPRLGYLREPMLPNNLTLTVLGAGLLWFGWFGFNAGSALAAGGLAGSAFVATHIASAAATLSWIIAEWLHRRRPSALGAVSGCVAGLVAVTPAAGFVSPQSALIIGLIAGAVCYGAVIAKPRLRYDDSLDAFGIHGVGGTLGALLTGVFASKVINSAGADGLIYGGVQLFTAQLLAIGATWLYAAVVTAIILKVLDALMGLRVKEEEEVTGLDLTLHGESGYNFMSEAAV
ncbi:MAG: ammonium transporter [Armatimonadota bacterium]|nr:ammonium transporter [Armatimonadota bacterium]